MTSLSAKVSSSPQRSIGAAVETIASPWATTMSNTSDRSLRSLPKSSPIAIKRSDKLQRHVDSDDDSSSGASLAESVDRLTVGSFPTKKRGFAKKANTLAKSMPAPRLTAKKRESYDLPPMSLPEADAPDEAEGNGGSATYGSLRESHMKGRFLDGPMSYRDARSGQIHLMRQGRKSSEQASSLPHRYLQQNMPLSSSMADWSRVAPGTVESQVSPSPEFTHGKQESPPPGMMPGHRMRPSPKLQAQPSSKLADALQEGVDGDTQNAIRDTSEEHRTPPTPEHFSLYPTKFTRQQQEDKPLTSEEMLSTSLTGLELLQKTNSAHHHFGGGTLTPTTAMEFWKTNLETSMAKEPSPTTSLPRGGSSGSTQSPFDDPSSNDHHDSGVCFDLDL